MTPFESDPFERLPPELRLRILISTDCTLLLHQLIRASPVLLGQYLAHKSYIVHQILDFDEDMMQDAMAIILAPPNENANDNTRASATTVLRLWSERRLRDPFKTNSHHLASQVSQLVDRMMLLAEDYITKATSPFPPRAYLCLPPYRQPSADGHLLFKGVKITPRFNLANLRYSEKKRVVKAFLMYELSCKVGYHPSIDKMKGPGITKAELQVSRCVRAYCCSLYGAIFAQCTDAQLETELQFPDNFHFDANSHAHKLDLGYKTPGVKYPNYADAFASLGLDRTFNFLGQDMAKADEREVLRSQIQHVWIGECENGSWDSGHPYHDRWYDTPTDKDYYYSDIFKQLSLYKYSKLRQDIGYSGLGFSSMTNVFTPKRPSEDRSFQQTDSSGRYPSGLLVAWTGSITRIQKDRSDERHCAMKHRP